MSEHPNVVLIYADDLGFGDVGCYDDRCQIPTPNIDSLAEKGIRFTNAHAPDTICSPSRYGILTGRYSWRTSRKTGNPAPGEQPWIDADRTTLASILKDCGYDTAALGKWGLGADWENAARPEREGLDISPDAIDYSKKIPVGECVGFTYDDLHLWYGRDYYETTYPCGQEEGAAEETDGGRWYFENGWSLDGEPRFEDFDMEEAQMHYIRRAVDYIDANGGQSHDPAYNVDPDSPFFLYYAPHIPHWPHVPAPRFQGTTDMGYYGDFVVELDWAVGQIMEALERNDMADNTVVIFCSDNGPEHQCYDYIQDYDHYSMGELRGIKRDLWEGGHRTPFILSWPGEDVESRVSERFLSQTDIIATLADYLDYDLGDDAAEDSFSFLDELIVDHSVPRQRDVAIYHSATGKMAIRKGPWVLVDAPSGDDIGAEPEWFRAMRDVESHDQERELFHIGRDPQQRENLYADKPEKARELLDLLQDFIDGQRTAPPR